MAAAKESTKQNGSGHNEHTPVTKFPTTLPENIDPVIREVFLTLNDWAKELQRWGLDVSKAVGHPEGAGDHAHDRGAIATSSPTHIVGDPPKPPFDE